MTATLHEPTEAQTGAAVCLQLLRDILEEQFAVHTNRLTELVLCAELPHHGGHDPQTLAASTEASRRAVADTARALQRMSQGTYGLCQGCHHAIPLGRLRKSPTTAFCVPCQQARSSRSSPADRG